MKTESHNPDPNAGHAELFARPSDRLELFLLACEEERHLHSLFRDVTSGRADVSTSITIMRRASERLAAALKELDP